VRRGQAFLDRCGRAGDCRTLYELFVAQVRRLISEVATADSAPRCKVELVNDGPVTILLDSPKHLVLRWCLNSVEKLNDPLNHTKRH